MAKEKMDKEKMEVDKTIEFLLDQLVAKETTEGIGCDNMSCILVRFK